MGSEYDQEAVTQEFYTDQDYYGQDEQFHDTGSSGEELTAVASVPWVAIALAVHIVLLVVAWFIIPQMPQRAQLEVLQAQQEQIAEPPPPEQPPDKPVEFPKDEPEQENPSEDERISDDPNDTVNEDPTDVPKNDLAENPNENPSDNESPHPNRDSTTSATGLGGGLGGGGGRGGMGGFKHRRAPGGGGKKPHEERTRAALDWLRDHQNREGYWSATTFSEDSARTNAEKTFNIEFVDVGQASGDKGWEASCDIGLTGLSLLAFVGAGYDHKNGDYRATCRQAILYLRKVQDNDGCFGPKHDEHFVYNHAICAMAMAEAYGLSGDSVLKPIADKAVEFILKAQNPGLGWRYGVRYAEKYSDGNDSSVTGWMVLALKSCKMAGLQFDTTKCYADAAEWFKVATVDVNGYPKTGYDKPGNGASRLRSADGYDRPPSMDSIYVMSMLFMGKADLNDPTVKKLAHVCIEKGHLPVWEHSKIDYYYWYYASLALYQVGGNIWKTWEKSMSKVLLSSQRGYHEADMAAGRTSKEVLDEHGSWDAVDAWGSAGGRVYSTAINCLTLEVYYRYLRLEDEK